MTIDRPSHRRRVLGLTTKPSHANRRIQSHGWWLLAVLFTTRTIH